MVEISNLNNQVYTIMLNQADCEELCAIYDARNVDVDVDDDETKNVRKLQKMFKHGRKKSDIMRFS